APGGLAGLAVAGQESSHGALRVALAGDEPQVALRDGAAYAPRLRPVEPADRLTPPPGTGWSMDITTPGTFANLAFVTSAAGTAPLEPGQVRVAVRAAGLNFRDVLLALGMYPGQARLGGEGAGVVLEVAPDVTGLAPGDRVMGLIPGAIAPVTIADHRLLIRIPDGWSFASAAASPIAYLTAYRGLVDLAGLRAG